MKNRKLKDDPAAYQGYRYIPAGICKDHYSAMCIYVRYRQSATKGSIIVKRRTDTYLWLVCPDRELVFGYASHLINDFNPDSFDECVHFDMFNETVARSFDLSYVMPNFVHDQGVRKSPISRRKGNSRKVGDPERLTILSDSGGFQYASGAADYISPKDLGSWYRNNVDAGMVLDIPVPTTIGKEWLDKLTSLQNRNTAILKKYCGDHVELVNIQHGKSTAERAYYRERIEEAHPDLKRLALGGAASSGINPVLFADFLLDATMTGKRYSQYHVLGATSSVIFPLLISLSDFDESSPHITSDSTTHKQSGLNRKVYFQRNPGELRTRDLGLVAGRPNIHWKLDCSCPVCSIVKYRDIFGILPGQFALSLMSIHNMHETSNYINFMKESFRTLPREDFIALVRRTHSTSSTAKSREMVMAMDYIFTACEKGLSKARKKYGTSVKSAQTKYESAMNNTARRTLLGGTDDNLSSRQKRFKVLQEIYHGSMERIEAIENEV